MGAVSEFIRELQSYEEYAFSLQELKRTTKAPESSLRKETSPLRKTTSDLRKTHSSRFSSGFEFR